MIKIFLKNNFKFVIFLIIGCTLSFFLVVYIILNSHNGNDKYITNIKKKIDEPNSKKNNNYYSTQFINQKYNEKHQLIEEYDPQKHITIQYFYNNNFLKERKENFKDKTYKRYDSKGKLFQASKQDGTILEYNDQDQIKIELLLNGEKRFYKYNENKQVQKITYNEKKTDPDISSEEFDYLNGSAKPSFTKITYTNGNAKIIDSKGYKKYSCYELNKKYIPHEEGYRFTPRKNIPEGKSCADLSIYGFVSHKMPNPEPIKKENISSRSL